ncbi:hypothetical protein LTR36_002042 [Oleoguttula mirabilis]|uniref:Translation initiation factor 3 N-terminal domain-containing protein n=1 Tax=Oleoguttula mirabilis TaxID=1507867 RepID=A0AAV9JMZ7_9PEZI|nr:hypothetical protein LTR36_002042 [Oleoguttula mirabilis]
MATIHASSSLQALYRVFVLPTLSKSPPLLRRAGRQAPPPPQPQHQRPFSASAPHAVKTRAPEERAHKWDEEIRARLLYFVDPETGKREEEPRTRYDVLNTLNRQTHRLVQLSPDQPGNRDFIPVCKVVSKKEQYETEQRAKKAVKEKKAESNKVNSVKTLELNWAIDGNDLGHRLERVAGFLGEGRRVEIVLAAKKQGRKATGPECEGVVKRILETVGAVPGARELKPLDGKMGGFATIVLQGRAPGQGKQSDAS